MLVKRIILLPALVVLQLCFSSTLIADKPSENELFDQGYILVCDFETPPLDERTQETESRLNEVLERQTTSKGVEKTQKRIQKLHSDWEKKSPKIALVQFASATLQYESSLPIKLKTERKHKLEKGKYYYAKLIRPKTLKTNEGFLLPVNGRLVIAKKEEESKPGIFESIVFGMSSWSPNVDTEGLIVLKDCKFVSQETVTSPAQYVNTAAGPMRVGGGTRRFTVYEMVIQNSSDKKILSARVVCFLNKNDGEMIESTEELITCSDLLPLATKKIRMECIGSLDDLNGSIKVISMKTEDYSFIFPE